MSSHAVSFSSFLRGKQLRSRYEHLQPRPLPMALLTRSLSVCLPSRLAQSRFRARALPQLARFSAYASADLPAELNSRVYTSYDVFKGKSAMNVKVISPTFTQSTNGGPLTLKKAGALLLECAPGAARSYDWSKKLAMALSVTEMAEILAFTSEAGSLEFVHDPMARSVSESAQRSRKPLAVTC